MKSRPTKEELSELYWGKKMSPNKIAEIYNVNGTTVSKWIKDYRIRIRSRSEACVLRSESKTPTREELERMYNIDGLNQSQIGERYGVSDSTVSNWMKDYNISTDRSDKPTREELERLYVHEKMSTNEISKIYKVTNGSVLNWMRDYKIKRRTNSESHLIFNDKELKIKGLPNKSELEELSKRMSSVEIGEKFGIAAQTVLRLMDRYGIERKKLIRNVKNGTWRNLEFVLERVRLFLEQHPEYDNLPTSDILIKEGCSSLLNAIKRYHGGYSAFREKLGQFLEQKPSLLEQYAGGER